jgi:hypothetical protein
MEPSAQAKPGGIACKAHQPKERKSPMDAPESILAQPYGDRQLLVVADEIRPPEKAPEPSELFGVNKSIWEVAAAVIPVVLSPGAGLATLAVQRLINWNEERARRATEEGVHIRSVTRADIQGLLFPPGHPRRKVVYVGHPSLKRQYIPFASFHRALFEQKAIEAMELLAGLGATSIKIRQVAGTATSASIAASLGVPIQGVTVDVGSDVGKQASQNSEILLSATLAPTQAPRVPDGLIWYPHERTWQGVAKMRLKNGLETYALEVDYKDDYGINAKVSAKIADIGFDTGGSYSNIESTKWIMQGEFAPLHTLPPAHPGDNER